MQYLEETLKVPSVDVLVLGLGGVVNKENEKVGEAPAAQWAHIRRARHFSCSHDDLQLLVRGDLD